MAWFAICFRLGALPLLSPDEGRNAEVAREMKESGAWLVPTYNGLTYLDKPAFYFKAVALSLAAFGDSETAARIPSAVFGLGLLGAIFAFCRREYGARCAVLAVSVVASMPLFLLHSRTVIFDIALAGFTSAAIFAGYLAEESEGKARRNWYAIGAALAGFATLVKGPVGFLVPILVLWTFNRVEGRKRILRRFFAPLNLLVFFGVVLPWFIGVSRANPDFPYYGIVEESFHRFTTTSFHRTQPFYFYAIIVAGMFFPWSLLLPEAGVALWKLRRTASRTDRLCLIWAVVVVIFFSLSKSKLSGYVLTATVAGGILVARVFAQALADPDGKPARIVRRAAVGLTIVCLTAAGAVVFLSTRLQLLAHPLGIPPAAAEQFHQFTTAAIILFVVFAALGLLARFRRDVGLCFVCFALFPLLLVHVNRGILQVVFDTKSARILAQQIPSLPPNAELTFLECFPAGLPFYLDHTATLISKDGSELTSNYIVFHLKSEPAWPSNLVSVTELDHWLAGRDHPVYLLAPQRARAKLDAIAAGRGTVSQQLTPQYSGVLLPSPSP